MEEVEADYKGKGLSVSIGAEPDSVNDFSDTGSKQKYRCEGILSVQSAYYTQLIPYKLTLRVGAE